MRAFFGVIRRQPGRGVVDLPGLAVSSRRAASGSSSRVGLTVRRYLRIGVMTADPTAATPPTAAARGPSPPRRRAEAATAAPSLEVDHVSRWYGNVVAVNDVSFALGRASPVCSGRTAPASRRCST